ncbi:hypothetical protein Droror1_Dr00006117 [Drosera rotundifolia]
MEQESEEGWSLIADKRTSKSRWSFLGQCSCEKGEKGLSGEAWRWQRRPQSEEGTPAALSLSQPCRYLPTHPPPPPTSSSVAPSWIVAEFQKRSLPESSSFAALSSLLSQRICQRISSPRHAQSPLLSQNQSRRIRFNPKNPRFRNHH